MIMKNINLSMFLVVIFSISCNEKSSTSSNTNCEKEISRLTDTIVSLKLKIAKVNEMQLQDNNNQSINLSQIKGVRTYKGEWTCPNQPKFKFEIKLNLSNRDINTSISWTNQSTNVTAREFVSGVYEPSSRSIFCRGTRVDSPRAIAIDKYFFIFSCNGDSIMGYSESFNPDSWPGRFLGRSID